MATVRPGRSVHLRDAPLSYAFARPEPDGWDAAFAEVGPQFEQAMAALRDEGQAQEEDELDTAARGLMESTADGILLPILRSASIPGSEMIRELMPHWDVIPGKLFVTLAYVAMTPRGTVGMRHVMNDQVDFRDAFMQATVSLAEGLRIEGMGDETGVTMLRMRRDDFLAGSAIMLPGFHQRGLDLQGWEEQIVAITCPDDLFIAPAGSPAADQLRRAVQEAEQQSGEFRPSLLRVTAEGMELILEGGR